MAEGQGVEIVQEIARALPPGWRWRPQLMEGGEAQQLLRRQADVGLPESARDEILESGLEILGDC